MEILKDGKWYEVKDNLTAAELNQFLLGQLQATYLREETPQMLDDDEIKRLKLLQDLQKGKDLIEMFLFDNRKIPLNSSQIFSLMKKFKDIEDLARLGSMAEVKKILTALPPDDIFTQQRKDKYLSLITN